MIKLMKFILFQLLLIIVLSGSQAYGQWKKCMDLCLKAGTLVGGATSVIATPFIGAWFGIGTTTICYLVCGPGTSIVRCFHEDTLIMTKNGPVLVKYLKKGDKILTANFEETKILQIQFDENENQFIQIYTSNTILEVTPQHLMIVEEKLIKAKNLQIGMKVGDYEILELKPCIKKGRVTLLVEQGTLIANGIPKTIICEEYENMTLIEGLKKWKQDHIGIISK